MRIIICFLIAISISTVSFSQNTLLIHYKSCFDNDLKNWTQSFTNFRLAKFKTSDTIKFENIPFENIKDLKSFYKLYKPALSFSFDSSKFIDIYSYWLNLEKQGNKIVADVAIDQAVSLCDLKNNKWTRIFFCGSSTSIEEVSWIDAKKFILAGSYSDEKNLFHPKILIGDVVKKIFITYVDSSSVANKIGYVSPKFKKLKIEE